MNNTKITVKIADTPINDHMWYGDLVNPYIIINQGVTRLFFSDLAYDNFLEGIA